MGQWLEVADFILDIECLLSCRIWAVVWSLGVDPPLNHEKGACSKLILSFLSSGELFKKARNKATIMSDSRAFINIICFVIVPTAEPILSAEGQGGRREAFSERK